MCAELRESEVKGADVEAGAGKADVWRNPVSQLSFCIDPREQRASTKGSRRRRKMELRRERRRSLTAFLLDHLWSPTLPPYANPLHRPPTPSPHLNPKHDGHGTTLASPTTASSLQPQGPSPLRTIERKGKRERERERESRREKVLKRTLRCFAVAWRA